MKTKNRKPSILGISQIIMILFLLGLLVLSSALQMDTATLISDSLVRIGMQAIFVLAMLPTIQSGIGLNFGLPLGILCGLLGGLITVEYNMTGLGGLFTAILISLPLSAGAGILYGWVLNHMRGSEMMVGNYLNFSIISLMCIGWDSSLYQQKYYLGHGQRSAKHDHTGIQLRTCPGQAPELWICRYYHSHGYISGNRPAVYCHVSLPAQQAGHHDAVQR